MRLYRCVDKKASEQLVETAFKTIQNPSFEDLVSLAESPPPFTHP